MMPTLWTGRSKKSNTKRKKGAKPAPPKKLTKSQSTSQRIQAEMRAKKRYDARVWKGFGEPQPAGKVKKYTLSPEEIEELLNKKV
ncbi:hypothetical protein [Paenibacillus gallinarum]|uniref:Uncharacterized protein n=1 Tax=Paenibacillus gallinarum TaxID=2762232 RepID=A0ABR8T3K7_9BACL|nr:hypothetical protein [Paenibacillus gallinarum]MBD7970345.1 hypothetical protein [Paenibacillus gallinarum]